MSYVLDTNSVSALMKGDPAAIERLAAINRADVKVPQPVVAEIDDGVLVTSNANDMARIPGLTIEDWGRR
jgi:predicted nucleic acid-binding protein